MNLKKRLVLLIIVSILFLAVLSHFIFNLTVFQFFEEADLIGSNLENHFRQHIVLFVFFMLTSMTAVGIFVYLFSSKHITKRMSQVSEDIKKIQGLNDLTIRLPADFKRDEVSELVANFNVMLDLLESEKNERQCIEKALITHEKLASIGRLASSIAHELNNPILVISNCLQVIKKDWRSDPETVQEALLISEGEIDRIRNIVSGLLDFHRMDKGEFNPVDLNRIVKQSIEMLNWSRKLKNLEIEIIEKENFSVCGSKGKLKQVFINLIGNTAEAVDGQDGRLVIEIARSSEPNTVDVHLYDNGPGIPSHMRDTLFEPFNTTKKDKGVGLGLYVSQKIIKNHKGRIYHDANYQDGTHFIVNLPVLEKSRSQNANNRQS